MTTLKLFKLLPTLLLSATLGSSIASAQDLGESTTEPTSPKDTATTEALVDVSGLSDVSGANIGFVEDILMIYNNGARMAFEVSKSEFYLKDKLTGESNIESLAAGYTSAEEMRQFVSSEDAVWGQDCMLVLYRAGMPRTDENRYMLTNKIEIKLDLEVASMELLHRLADAVGVQVGSTEIGKSGSAWLLATCGGTAVKAAEILDSHPSVLRARPITTIPLEKMTVPPGPNDQYYNVTAQFYVHHDYPFIDQVVAWPVWCGNAPLQQAYFGRGVEISLLDDGVQGDHPDLEHAYIFRKDTDFTDGDNDGAPANFQDNHGTEMAGIIVARQNNGIGIAGIAPAASLFSTRCRSAASDPQILSDALEHESNTVDLIVSGFVPGGNYVDISELVADSLDKMADKKDVPIAYPAGDAGGVARVDYDRLASHRYTIATAAYMAPSEPGCSLIVVAPGFEMGTTDRTGEDGDSDEDYMFDFGGTSAANACTAGVLALMQDARPNLGWRDYQEILLLTANKWAFPPFSANYADPVDVPGIGSLGFAFAYQYGGGMVDAYFAVATAEVWARLPGSAAAYKVASRRERISEDIGVTKLDLQDDGTYDLINPIRTYLFDFNRVVPSKQNLRIEHIEVRLKWEEPPSGAPAQLLPAYVHLNSPYYLNGPDNYEDDDINDRPGFAPIGGYDSARREFVPGAPFPPINLLTSSSQFTGLPAEADSDQPSNLVNSPVEWTYTTVRHWGEVNTGGFERTGVPEQGTDIIGPGVWELDVGIEPYLVVDFDGTPQPTHPDSRLTRRLIEAEIYMYGTENNIPPRVVSATISSSGNPGVFSPRTAFEDEDLLVENVVFFDPEGDPLSVAYTWQILGEDGLTWVDIGSTDFTPGECDYDQNVRIEAIANVAGSLYDRYFTIYEPSGTSVALYFQELGSTSIPAGAQTADRAIPIIGVFPNEGAPGVAADIALAINDDAGFAAVPMIATATDEQVLIVYPQANGNIIPPDVGTSNMVVTEVVSQDPSGNCFGPSSARLDASDTVAANKYRAVITPRDGLREGFRFITDPIIVNSRPVYTATHDIPYFYDVDLWIETVPPDSLAPFGYINEVSQGTGDTTTNQEWVEIMINYTVDMRGYKLTNDIAGFDLTFTNDPVWDEVPFGTVIVIYNGDQRDPILPPDTPYPDLIGTPRWILSSTNGTLFQGPANGDGWGEFSNIDCTPEERDCDGANVALLTPFATRSAVHGVSFNGNMQYVDAGIARAQEALLFDGTELIPGDPTMEPWSPTDPDGWLEGSAADATPGLPNSDNNQVILDTIVAEAKTSVPSYRFYPGDGSQAVIDPMDGRPVLDDLGNPIPDDVPSDLVPGLSINRKTGVLAGRPDVPGGGTFTIKIQRFHSFSSEIQIYELEVLPYPPLADDEDEDGDGIINLMEEALGTDPFSAQANVLPTGQMSTFLTRDYPSISFRRLKGGVLDPATNTYTFDDLLYEVEATGDLTAWLGAPDVFVIQESVVDSADAPDTVEIATFRVMNPVGTPVTGDRYYLRLSVTRLEP